MNDHRISHRVLARGAALAALVMLAGACGDDSPPSASSSPTTSPVATTTVAVTTVGATTIAEQDPLSGTWVSGDVTCDVMKATLTRAGYTADQLTSVGFDPNTCADGPPLGTFTIRFSKGHLVEFEGTDVGWDGAYKIVDDRTFVAGDNGTYYITYSYAIVGDQLTIDMTKDAIGPEPNGDAVAQTVIYESTPFTRVP